MRIDDTAMEIENEIAGNKADLQKRDALALLHTLHGTKITFPLCIERDGVRYVYADGENVTIAETDEEVDRIIASLTPASP